MSALNKGDTVLVTGATGYIGGHVANDLLAHGAKVKLVVRSEEKAAKVVKALQKIHGQSAPIETVVVKDFGVPGAFDEAVKGVQGVAHVASDVSFSQDPKQVIDPVLALYKNLLGSLENAPEIRRFVFTSSSIALGFANTAGEETQRLTRATWNDKAVEIVKQGGELSAVPVYAASKVLSERLVWDFVKEKKPTFVTTSVNPNLNLGPFLPGLEPQSTGAVVASALNGDTSFLSFIGPQYHVDVRDVAELHSLALFKEQVGNERLLGLATRFTLNDVIRAVKGAAPDAKIDTKDEWDTEDNSTVDVKRSEEVLGRPFRTLEESVRDTIQAL